MDNLKNSIEIAYKEIKRSLGRKDSLLADKSKLDKWDEAYFTGMGSGLDRALEILEINFPFLKEIAKD